MNQPTIADLQGQIRQLQEESRLKTNWISLITHDSKEVFGTLIWLINALQSDTISREDFMTMLPEIKEGAERNLKTVSDTTDWIKTQYGNFKPQIKPVFVYEFYLQLKKRNEKKLADKGLSFNFEGNKELVLNTDYTMAFFIFNKLLENAIQFSYDSTHIDFIVFEEKHCLSVRVKDYGQGISPNAVEKIFTFDGPKFEGTKGEKGAGLSLKVVKEFVQLLGAKIEFEIRDNGTTVHVMLPHYEI